MCSFLPSFLLFFPPFSYHLAVFVDYTGAFLVYPPLTLLEPYRPNKLEYAQTLCYNYLLYMYTFHLPLFCFCLLFACLYFFECCTTYSQPVFVTHLFFFTVLIAEPLGRLPLHPVGEVQVLLAVLSVVVRQEKHRPVRPSHNYVVLVTLECVG